MHNILHGVRYSLNWIFKIRELFWFALYIPGTDRISRIMVKNQFTIDLINTSLLDVPAGTYKTGDSMFIDGTKCDVLYFPRSADLANLSSEVVEIQHTVTHEFMCRAVQYCLNVHKRSTSSQSYS